MKSLLASTCLILGAVAGTSMANAAECGHVTLASMNWQSAEVLSSIDKLILTEGYGCNVDVMVGDTVPTITSMAEKGEPDVAPEAWVDLLPEVVKRGTDEGRIIQVGKPFEDGGVQGWWVPKYFADAHPEIKSIPDLLEHPDLIPDPEDPSKGAIYNGPQGWGGTVVTAQFFKAYDAEAKGWRLVDTGSAAGLDGSIAKAYERQEGWAGYYWAPTALLGKYDMVKLDYGAEHDEAEWKRCNTVAECPDPKPNAWPIDTIVTLVAKSFSERVDPEVIDYFDKRMLANDAINKLMAWMTDNQATGDDGAKYFLQENPDVWKAWVSADAATKIEAAL